MNWWLNSFIYIMAIPTALLLMNTLYRTYKELRESYFDLFRLSQYLFLLVYLTAWMIFYFTITFDVDIKVYEIAVWIASGTNIAYIVVNLLLWVLVIVHLSNLVKLDKGQKFIKNRKKVIRIEIFSILIALMIFFMVLTVNGISAFYAIRKENGTQDLEEEDDKNEHFIIIDIISCVLSITLYLIFMSSELYLIIKLMKLVKKYCHYDKQYSKFFPWLAGSNIIYYWFQLATFITMLATQTTYCDLSRVDKDSTGMSRGVKVMLFVFNNNLPLAYAYLNIKNVSFKTYVANILPGIGKPYLCPSKISLFIVPSCRDDPDSDEERKEESGMSGINHSNTQSYILSEDLPLLDHEGISSVENIVSNHVLNHRSGHNNSYFQLD
ncbi:unnamed protein product [Moneuplotes crassus]|uniref:Uncharacterized protein n=1 Tax=Euplotes crassus TaxID=5936 RepID=A0AAD1UUQ2_EUPCR|nr:unnamed protein product [Moneuplotes crassus]